MPAADRSARRLWSRAWTLVALTVACAVACALLQLFAVRPFLPPAGHGATLAGEATVMEGAAARLPMARPPVPGAAVGPRHRARGAGRQPGRARGPAAGRRRPARPQPADGPRASICRRRHRDADDAMRRWRDAYRLGTRGPLDVRVRHADGARRTWCASSVRRPGRCRGRRGLAPLRGPSRARSSRCSRLSGPRWCCCCCGRAMRRHC